MQGEATNKLKYLLVALVLGLLVGAAALASSGETETGLDGPATGTSSAAKKTYALLAGIPQHGTVLGSPKAPVTLQFFADLQCELSRKAMLGALPFLIRRWVRAGKLKIRFRSVETDTRLGGGWPEFREQQVAALAAGVQGRLWNYVSVFYREQKPEGTRYADEIFLSRIAVQAGIDLEPWERDRGRDAWLAELDADAALAKGKNLGSTPSFLIGPSGGKPRPLRHFALEEPGVFEEAIKELQ